MNEPAKSSAGKLSISPPICDGFFSGDGSVCRGVSVGGVFCTCSWTQCWGVGLWHTGTYMFACVCTLPITHTHTHTHTHTLPFVHSSTGSCAHHLHTFFFYIQKHQLTPVHSQKHKVPQQIDLCSRTFSQSPRATETNSTHVRIRELDPKEG